jgi:6,7-dimethyl-8-ribityllumazine synthase
MTRAGHDASPKLSGELSTADLKVGIVVSRFNSVITDRLLSGALDALQSAGGGAHGENGKRGESAGVPRENIEIVRVPGSLEIPIAATKMVEARHPDVVICIGCVLRGETSHYDLVCSEVARGVQLAQLDAGTPMIFCVLTCDTLEQAMERSGSKSGNQDSGDKRFGNKGFDAGLAAVEMANLCRKLSAVKAADITEREAVAVIAAEHEAASGSGGAVACKRSSSVPARKRSNGRRRR